MTRITTSVVLGLALSLSVSGAFAHAFLKSSVPAVGSTGAAPAELKLTFTESVVPALSGVKVTNAGGAVAMSKPDEKGGTPTIVVRPAQPLKPGAYTVSWHVVSVDSHKTQGSYKFTVTP